MMRRLFPSEVRTCSSLLSKFWMRWSNVCTDWMGHGQRKCGPGPAWLLTRPKVVTTANSVLRTWNRNRSRTKISSKNAPTAMVMGFGFIAGGERLDRVRGDCPSFGFGWGQRDVEDVATELVFQVQLVNLRRVGQDADILAHAAAVARERLQVSAL